MNILKNIGVSFGWAEPHTVTVEIKTRDGHCNVTYIANTEEEEILAHHMANEWQWDAADTRADYNDNLLNIESRLGLKRHESKKPNAQAAFEFHGLEDGQDCVTFEHWRYGKPAAFRHAS
jgi:hypothetical protein